MGNGIGGFMGGQQAQQVQQVRRSAVFLYPQR